MSKLKGWWGEKTSQFGLWLYLDKAKYKRLHNLIIDSGGTTTQIDHVYLSQFGIFVLETKHYGGWIFGTEKDKTWTQAFHNGRKYKFQNPLHQNYRHTKAISEKLVISHDHVHSVIVFTGEKLEIKTQVPPNVVISPYRAAQYIKTFDKIVFTDEELWQFENNIYGLHASQVSEQEHLYNLRNRYEDKDNCPKCGSVMVKKTARKGKNKGGTFMACSAYPKCKYISETATDKRFTD